ncbi:lasso peptide biosynthesis B2 protein [Mameliella alba]|uniref:Microcin J25-processing protein McjB C-terminal domain-containing protein n=1 Tax=Mameliella alba TaxID=561184 RepID=A0A0B3RG00_9RHOB|nr:lasso peptide biosynthesis B2 protein [Mameliella alba]KHQ50145.1 hypothetical protein OA50_05264 [Mameliella alba]
MLDDTGYPPGPPRPLRRVGRAVARHNLRLLEAMLMLAIAHVIAARPMKKQALALGKYGCETPTKLDPAHLGRARRITSAVIAVAKISPRSVCIQQTIAAQLSLRLRGLPATAYIGVHRNPAQRSADPRGYNAHVWLRVGDRVLIGGPRVSMYVPLASFAPAAGEH